jgi:hypothetical protein
MIIHAKQQFFLNSNDFLDKNSSDPKLFWSLVKKLMGNVGRSCTMPPLLDTENYILCVDDIDKCNLLNSFLCSISNLDDNNCNPPNLELRTNWHMLLIFGCLRIFLWRESRISISLLIPELNHGLSRSRIVIVFVGIRSRANKVFFCKSHTHHVYILCTNRQQLIHATVINRGLVLVLKEKWKFAILFIKKYANSRILITYAKGIKLMTWLSMQSNSFFLIQTTFLTRIRQILH